MLENLRQPIVRIEQNTLIINSIVIPYSKQIIRSPQTLFVTDLAIEVPITEQLREYDEAYFHLELKQQIVHELESNHVSVGLEILQQLSTLQAQHYEYILSKISLKKLIKMLMDDDFLMHLIHDLRRVTETQTKIDQDHQKFIIINLSQPYQRAIYLLKSFQQNYSTLKRQLEFTCKQLFQDIVLQPKFIEKMAFSSRFQSEFEETEKIEADILENHFLHKLYELIVHLRFLSKNTSIQWQIDQYYIDKVQRNKDQVIEMVNMLQDCINLSLKNYVFNKYCLNFIGKHFHHLFQNSRKDLLRMIGLIVSHNREQFWKDVIIIKGAISKQNLQQELVHDGNELIDNVDSLRQLILSSYFGKDKNSWSLTLLILQKFNQMQEAEYLLVDIYLDFVQSPLTIDTIELISKFIKHLSQSGRSGQLSPQLKILIPAFMESIIQQIDTIWKACQKQKQGKQPQCPFLIIYLPIPKFPKIKTSYLCASLGAFSAIISSGFLDYINGLHFQTAILHLIALNKGRDNIMHGSIAQFIRLIEEKVKENSTGQYSIRNIIKTSCQKQQPRHSLSLTRLKSLLRELKQL